MTRIKSQDGKQDQKKSTFVLILLILSFIRVIRVPSLRFSALADASGPDRTQSDPVSNECSGCRPRCGVGFRNPPGIPHPDRLSYSHLRARCPAAGVGPMRRLLVLVLALTATPTATAQDKAAVAFFESK